MDRLRFRPMYRVCIGRREGDGGTESSVQDRKEALSDKLRRQKRYRARRNTQSISPTETTSEDMWR
jgi:hypothetical protein